MGMGKVQTLQMNQSDLMNAPNDVTTTTSGGNNSRHSQKLLTVSETVNLTETNVENSHQRHNRQHNDAKDHFSGSFLGVPVKLSNGIAANQTCIHR